MELPEDSRENDQSQSDADVIDAAIPEPSGGDIEIQNTVSYDAAASALLVQEQVQALIDALPEAEEITADNRADVEAQLTAIDEAKLALTDEEKAALDVTRYDAAVEAIQTLDGMSGADERMSAMWMKTAIQSCKAMLQWWIAAPHGTKAGMW